MRKEELAGVRLCLSPEAQARLMERFGLSAQALEQSVRNLGARGLRVAADGSVAREARKLLRGLRRGRRPYVMDLCPRWGARVNGLWTGARARRMPRAPRGCVRVVGCAAQRDGAALTEHELARMLADSGCRPVAAPRPPCGQDRLSRLLMTAMALSGQTGQAPVFRPAPGLAGVQECAVRLAGRVIRAARVCDPQQARALLADAQERYDVLEALSCAGGCDRG